MSSQSRRTPEFCTAFYWRNISKDRHVWARTRHSNIVTLFPRCHHIYLLSPNWGPILLTSTIITIATTSQTWSGLSKWNTTHSWCLFSILASILADIIHWPRFYSYIIVAYALWLRHSLFRMRPASTFLCDVSVQCTCVPLDELRCGNEWRRRQGGAEPDGGNDDFRTQAAGILACRCEWVLKHPVPCGQQHAIASPAQKYCWILRVAGPVPMFHTLHNSTFICFFLLSMHASLSLSRYIYK